jgi:hypothetical protein
MTIKEILILLLLTTVMGYILGLMISTTVNYKLKDFIVNLPRPIIKMKHPLNKKFNRKNKMKKIVNSEETIEKFTNKPTKKHKKNKKYDVKGQIDSSLSITDNIKNKAIEERSKYYRVNLKDENAEAYSKIFNKNNEKTKNDAIKFTYSAYNEEDGDEYYNFLENENPKNKNKKDLKLLDKIKKNINKVRAIIPREKRCPNYKCSKPWQNCTSKHKRVIK